MSRVQKLIHIECDDHIRSCIRQIITQKYYSESVATYFLALTLNSRVRFCMFVESKDMVGV